MKFNTLRAGLVTGVFLSILSFPLLNDRFHWITDIKSFENRALAPAPVFDKKAPGRFAPAFELFYNDHFSIRFRMIRAFNIYNLLVFQKSPCPEFVIIGRKGWLFLTGDEFDAYTGKTPFTPQELAAFKEELEYRRDYLGKRNCKFYLMIAPVKAAVYPERVPLEIVRKSDRSQGEVLLDYLKRTSGVNQVDLYGVLKEHKKDYQTYHALDNHWTRVGAFYGAKQFLTQAQKDFPALKIPALEEYQVNTAEINTGNTVKIFSGDIDIFKDVEYTLSLKGNSDLVEGKKAGYQSPKGFPTPYLFEEVSETADSTKPRLLIISDSFGEYIFPFLGSSFKKTVKIWDNWEYKLNEPIVENEKPDIVLLIIHEKNLRHILQLGKSLRP